MGDTTELDRLAHREGLLRWALDQCLLVILDRLPEADDHYGPLVAAIRTARPDLLAPPASEGDHAPSEQTRLDRSGLLVDSLERLADAVRELGEPGRLDYIRSTRETNARLLAENMRLKGLVAADPEVFRQMADGLAVRHWAVKLLAFGFADEFKRAGAKNFVVFELYPPDMPRISVTMQVLGGVTPAERIAALEQEVAELRAQVPGNDPAASA